MLRESEYSEASAEEKLVAGVLLAGWHIQRFAAAGVQWRYGLYSPTRRYCGSWPTRYLAALAAEKAMEDA